MSLNVRAGIAKELHKQARKRFPTRNFELKGIDDLYEADLVEMIPYADKNNQYKYILTMINCFSKFAFAIPLKTKSGDEVAKALEPIMQSYKIKHLHTDEGKEWFNTRVKSLLRRFNINHYITYSGKKAVFVERFNRTLKSKMWRLFTERGSYRWLDILKGLVDEYNETVHSTIKMKPKDVNKENEKEVLFNIRESRKKKIPSRKQRFEVGDKVRISKYKKTFDKGYWPNWTNEVFTISKVMPTKPITYKLKDERGECIKGGFYSEELQKSQFGGVFLVEKVLKKRGSKLLVRWKGFDKTRDSWIDQKDLV